MDIIQRQNSESQPEPVIAPLNDRTIRWIGIPLISVIIPLITQFEDCIALKASFAINALITFFITLTFWEGNRWIVVKVRRKYPDYDQIRQRIILEAILAMGYIIAATKLMEFLLSTVILRTAVQIDYRISVLTTLLVYLVYEAIYFFEAWKHHVRKSESLKRQQLESQLEALKTQLDPHFLFNSMNTLAALIDDSNSDAQQYLEHQSDVYRYVLMSRTRNTVVLEEEIAFLDAYIYLNKIRFRENLVVKNNISAETLRLYVAPLSLQILIENAIKHNTISKEHPLCISLREEEHYLVVENTLHKKNILEKSTKIGLQNVVNRYTLLTNRPVEVRTGAHYFTVRIPLLNEPA